MHVVLWLAIERLWSALGWLFLHLFAQIMGPENVSFTL